MVTLQTGTLQDEPKIDQIDGSGRRVNPANDTGNKSARRISAEKAAALVRSGDWIDYGAVLAQPDAFDKALAQRVDELRNVNIRGCLSVRPRAVVEADPRREPEPFRKIAVGQIRQAREGEHHERIFLVTIE